MINKIRAILLFTVIAILAVGGYFMLNEPASFSGNIKLKVLKSGVDVEIENFKVVHEVEGKKSWELEADLAQINHQDNVTHLKNIQLKMTRGENREFRIFADSGVLQNENNEFDLHGHVKFIGEPKFLLERLENRSSQPEQKP